MHRGTAFLSICGIRLIRRAGVRQGHGRTDGWTGETPSFVHPNDHRFVVENILATILANFKRFLSPPSLPSTPSFSYSDDDFFPLPRSSRTTFQLDSSVNHSESSLPALKRTRTRDIARHLFYFTPGLFRIPRGDRCCRRIS